MAQILEFLSVPKNQELVAWLAGGVCAAISTIWAMRVKRRAEREAAGSTAPAGNYNPRDQKYPRGVWVFASAGLALIVLSFALGGDRADSAAQVGSDMGDSGMGRDQTGQ